MTRFALCALAVVLLAGGGRQGDVDSRSSAELLALAALALVGYGLHRFDRCDRYVDRAVREALSVKSPPEDQGPGVQYAAAVEVRTPMGTAKTTLAWRGDRHITQSGHPL